MSDSQVNYSRRRFLTVTTAVVGGAGMTAASIPFIKSWNPTIQMQAAAAPVEVNIEKLEEGQLLRVQWQNKPVWVVKRPQVVLDELSKLHDQLLDPQSIEPQQPDYVDPIYRAVRPDIFVAIGICTHLGCSPLYQPDSFEQHVEGVKSGFFCPCHGSSFDMAGRVFKGVPAPLNLAIPPHFYQSDNQLVIGLDKEAV